MNTQEFYQQLTREQKSKISRLKSKRVIKNAGNRAIMIENFGNNTMLQIYNMMRGLMQGAVHQHNSIQTGMQNINVALEKLTKKARLHKEDDGNDQVN